MTLSIMAGEHSHAECCVFWLSLMLSATFMTFMLSVIILNAVMLFSFLGFCHNGFCYCVVQEAMRITLLPVSAARWQHGSWICYETLIYWKITKRVITQQPPLARNKTSTDLKNLLLLEFIFRLHLQTIKFYFIKLTTDFKWQSSYLLGVTLPLKLCFCWQGLAR